MSCDVRIYRQMTIQFLSPCRRSDTAEAVYAGRRFMREACGAEVQKAAVCALKAWLQAKRESVRVGRRGAENTGEIKTGGSDDGLFGAQKREQSPKRKMERGVGLFCGEGIGAEQYIDKRQYMRGRGFWMCGCFERCIGCIASDCKMRRTFNLLSGFWRGNNGECAGGLCMRDSGASHCLRGRD